MRSIPPSATLTPRTQWQACGITESPQALAPGTNKRREPRTCKGRNRVRDLMFCGPLGDLGALGVMRSIPPSATLTPRAQRAQRRAASGYPIPHLGALGALCVMRSLDTSTASHAKNAKCAKKGRVTVASHSELRRECHALFYGGAHARFCRESAPPLCARRLDGSRCQAAREKPW